VTFKVFSIPRKTDFYAEVTFRGIPHDSAEFLVVFVNDILYRLVKTEVHFPRKNGKWKKANFYENNLK
jgi:hypothetical protein